MIQKRTNPPAATGGLGIYCDRQAAKFHDPENNQHLAQKQDFRAGWLARRYRLTDAMAATVAEIAFNVGGAR
jgi:hypothetical protein